MLGENALLQAIKSVGTRRDFMRLLDISKQRLNGWLNEKKEMSFEYALAIEFITFGQIKAETLAPNKVSYLKKLGANIDFGFGVIPIQNVLISTIKTDNNKYFELSEIYQLASSIASKRLIRPILIDENNQLIFGMRRLQATNLLNQKYIKVYKLNLYKIIGNCETINELRNKFTLSERTAIGIKLEKVINHSHGGKRPPKQVHNFALEKSQKTRAFIAEIIGLGSHYTYDLAKIVLKQAHYKLIQAVDSNTISISSAAQLAKYSYEAQLTLLNEKLNITKKYNRSVIKHKEKLVGKLI